MRDRLRFREICAALLAGLALLGAGCGGGDEIPRGEAENLDRDLAELQDLIEAGACEEADQKVTEIGTAVESLGDEVDGEIRRGLRQLVDRVDRLFAEGACSDGTATEEVPTTTDTTETEETTDTTTTTTETTSEETTTDTEPTGRPDGGDGGENPGGGRGEPPPGAPPEEPGSGSGGIGDEEGEDG